MAGGWLRNKGKSGRSRNRRTYEKAGEEDENVHLIYQGSDVKRPRM